MSYTHLVRSALIININYTHERTHKNNCWIGYLEDDVLVEVEELVDVLLLEDVDVDVLVEELVDVLVLVDVEDEVLVDELVLEEDRKRVL